MLTSTRRSIVYPNPNRADTADVPRDFLAVIAALEIDVIYGQGTLAARPAAGLQGRMYCASDQTPKQFFWDDGAAWNAIGGITVSSINQMGTLTLRPAAGTVPSGTTYFATDQAVEYISDGVNWTRKSVPAGTTIDWFNDTLTPTGWVPYDATALPSSTGIYADLATHLGGTATPDTRGRVVVGRGTHADVDHVLDNDGVAIGLRRPRHKHTTGHTLTLPNHKHAPLTATYAFQVGHPVGGPYSSNGAGPANMDAAGMDLTTSDPTTLPAIPGSVTVGPQTGNEPTDSAAYITSVKLAKL